MVLEAYYVPVTGVQMLTSKTFSRALRGHFLTESAIFALILLNATASFQSDDQNRISETNETENESNHKVIIERKVNKKMKTHLTS